MRIVFMGTPEFAVPSLQRLFDDGHEIVGVFTQPDKPKGRSQKLTPSPVKELALAQGVPVYQPEKMRDGTALEILRKCAPDLAVVVAYGRILPQDILETPPMGCINVHGSLLPEYRGAAPIQWSVINGDAVAGVTTMHIGVGLDDGDMILKKETPIGENETSGELFERLSVIGAEALSETIALLAQGKAPRTPQDNGLATKAPMLEKSMAKIDFTKSARQVHSLVCGMNPWPIAHTTLEGGVLKVYRSRLVNTGGTAPEESGISPETAAGTVLAGYPGCKGLVVACKEGAVEFTELQLEGGKRMAAADYLRGHPIQAGTLLGKSL